MSDLFGLAQDPPPPFKDIANQRPSVAEEKANLCAELNTLLRRTPQPSRIASVQKSREFKHVHKSALKVLQNKASSRQELSTAIQSMKDWIAPPLPTSQPTEVDV